MKYEPSTSYFNVSKINTNAGAIFVFSCVMKLGLHFKTMHTAHRLNQQWRAASKEHIKI